jgi:hypothetical protein
MDPHSSNLILTPPSFGPLLFNPQGSPSDEARTDVGFILCTEAIPKKNLGVAIEWAASTEAPFFCSPSDADRLEREGFGAYRFQRIQSYRELGFQGGSLIFHPASGPRPKGFRGILRDLGDALGWGKRSAFHVVVKPMRGETTLYLSTPYVDSLEWQLLTDSKPKLVIGSASYPVEAWWGLSERFGYSIVRADTLTSAPGQGDASENAEASQAWLSKVSPASSQF